MTARNQLEGQIGLDERSQYFQIGIILQIRQLHSKRIVRTRTIGQEVGGWSLLISCSRATRGRGLPSLDARSGRSISPHP